MIIRRLTVRLVLVLSLLGSMAPAQLLPDPPEVTELPDWPSDGKIPTSLIDSLVFRDRTSGAIVVSYPNPNDPQQRLKFSFFLGNRVDPVLTAHITSVGELYSYDYGLTNGLKAATPIRGLWIVGPSEGDPNLELDHPTWRSVPGRRNVAPQAAIPIVPDGPYLAWRDPAIPLAIGDSIAGFSIVSSHRPGLTTAYAVGNGHIATSQPLSEEVYAALEPFNRTPVRWRPVLTLGPRYPAHLGLRELAAQFMADIESAVQTGALDGRSAFIVELLGRLADSASSGLAPQPVVAPREGIEAEIAEALRVNFPVVQ